MYNNSLLTRSGKKKKESPSSSSNSGRGNTSLSTVEADYPSYQTTNNRLAWTPRLLRNGAMPAYDQLVAEAEAEAERNVWETIQRALTDHSAASTSMGTLSQSHDNNNNNNNKRPRSIPHNESSLDRVARGLSIREREDLAREIVETKRIRLMEELSLLTTVATARESNCPEERQRSSYGTQYHQHFMLPEEQIRREHIDHYNNRYQMDFLDNLLFHARQDLSFSSNHQQNPIPYSLYPIMYRHEMQQQQRQQQQRHQQPEEEEEPPHWIWHKATDPIPIPPSQLVTKAIHSTTNDPHGSSQRYISTHVALSLPYEIAIQCDAPSLYASMKVALANAWVPSNSSIYNKKNNNNTTTTKKDIIDNMAVV